MEVRNIPFRMESEIVRAWYRLTGLRPASGEFISGDGFRSWASWTFEPGTKKPFDPLQVTPGGVVYCEGWSLVAFLSEVAPRIPVSFVLVVHNSDINITDETTRLFPPQVVRVFANNVLTNDSRVRPIPIGLENARWHYNGIVADFERLRRRTIAKTPRVLSAFTVSTNPTVRKTALETLTRLPIVDPVSRINSRAYRKLAAGYQFIASPPGNGVDCHRTWEALYLRAVPIVLRSVMTDAFVSLGLPLWTVGTYAELDGWSEAQLAAKYDDLEPGFAHPALGSSWWKEKILAGVARE
jgi:hypothetical protein